MAQIHDISQAHTLDYWRARATKAEDAAALVASELYTIQELVANPNLTDKEKIGAIAYYQWYRSTPPARDDGSKYFSLREIAERMGSPRTNPEVKSSKEQSFSPLHTKLKKAGLISTYTEAQKSNKSRQNYYDSLSPQFELNPRAIVLEKSGAAKPGGKRIAFHRECGGRCIDRTEYLCTRCGEARVPQEQILMIDEEKWERWQEEDISNAPTLTMPVIDVPIVKPMLSLPMTPIPECLVTPGQLPPLPDKFCTNCGRPRRVCWYPSSVAAGQWSASCQDHLVNSAIS